MSKNFINKLFNFAFAKTERLSKNQTLFFNLTSPPLFALLIFFWNRYVFQFDFMFDSLIFISSIDDKSALSLSYWINIFSGPNAWDIRYRPFGFFVYFLGLKKACGLNPVCAYSLNMGLFFLSSVFMFLILRLKSKPLFAPFVFSCLWILFFGLLYPILNISLGGKYLFPLFFMLLGFFLIEKSRRLSWPLSLVLALLSAFCVFGNEAHLGVSFVFLLILWSKGKLNSLQAFLISFPSLIYLFFRVFVWGFSESGAPEEVKFSAVFSLFPRFFLGLFWPPLRYEYFSLLLVALFFAVAGILVVFLLWAVFKKRSETAKLAVAYLLSLGLLTGPFALMPNRAEDSAFKFAVLASAPLFLFLFEVFSRFAKTAPLRALALLYMASQIYFSFGLRGFYSEKWLEFDRRHKKLSSKVKGRLAGQNQTYVFPLYKKETKKALYYSALVAAGVLAKDFPDMNFIFLRDPKEYKYSLLVKKGYIFKRFFKEGAFKAFDLFEQPIEDLYFPMDRAKKIYLLREDFNFPL